MLPNHLSDPPVTSWMTGAACRGMDPGLFVPAKGINVSKQARLACAGCECRDACREYAVADPSIRGYWGGTTERQRRSMRTPGYVSRRSLQTSTDIVCGTPAGYMRHWRRKEEACDECRFAHNARCVENSRQRRGLAS